MRSRPESWLYPTERGLYCEPGQFHIDPHLTVDRAVITHGHGDHARSGHRAVLATAETVEIMKTRMAGQLPYAFGYPFFRRYWRHDLAACPCNGRTDWF